MNLAEISSKSNQTTTSNSTKATCGNCSFCVWTCPYYMCENPKHPEYDKDSDYPIFVYTKQKACTLFIQKTLSQKAEMRFSEIIKYLNTKKAKECSFYGGSIHQAMIEVTDNQLYCYYGYYYIFIEYLEEEEYNPYHINMESQAVFVKQQNMKTKNFEVKSSSQEAVISLLQHQFNKKVKNKLNKNKEKRTQTYEQKRKCEG